jgi:hypothetical protein
MFTELFRVKRASRAIILITGRRLPDTGRARHSGQKWTGQAAGIQIGSFKFEISASAVAAVVAFAIS